MLLRNTRTSCFKSVIIEGAAATAVLVLINERKIKVFSYSSNISEDTHVVFKVEFLLQRIRDKQQQSDRGISKQVCTIFYCIF